MMPVRGGEGFVAWFYAVVYEKIRGYCGNAYVKYVIHALGVAIMVYGVYLFIGMMPSMASALGLFVILGGFVVFSIPLGVKEGGRKNEKRN